MKQTQVCLLWFILGRCMPRVGFDLHIWPCIGSQESYLSLTNCHSLHIKIKATLAMSTNTWTASELLLLVKCYIKVDQLMDKRLQRGLRVTFEGTWIAVAERFNRHPEHTRTISWMESNRAYREFSKACDRYRRIIEEVEEEDVFVPNRATFDSRYCHQYHSEFIGHEAYEERYSWMTRYGTD